MSEALSVHLPTVSAGGDDRDQNETMLAFARSDASHCTTKRAANSSWVWYALCGCRHVTCYQKARAGFNA